MPVSMVCDSSSSSTLSLNAAIRNSIGTSTTCEEKKLENQLGASAKRILLNKIEYEEVKNYNISVLDNLKSKYIVLKPSPHNKNGVVQKLVENTNSNISNHKIKSIAASSETIVKKPKDVIPEPNRLLYPREKIQIGWKSSGRKWQVGSGMINMGNTCYLNSTLQALFHVPSFANWLYSDQIHRDRCADTGVGTGCITCAMFKTLESTQTNQNAIKPWSVYSKLRFLCKHLVPGRQEDAHEFLRYLIDGMEKEYLKRFKNAKEFDQYSKETTPLNQILGGYLRSAVRCLSCQHVSTTFQHFEDLLLDIRKANTMEDALEGYFARERLEDMGYKCESCNTRVSATKQFFLERAPISLCIQLKRFSVLGSKINKHIQIKNKLDLTPYTSSYCKQLLMPHEKLSYKLVSMVTHLGSSQHCGHYTAIGLTDTGSYYQFDDSSVYPMPLQSVLNTNAYIMFYELEVPTAKVTSTVTTQTATATLTSFSMKSSLDKNINGNSNQNNSPKVEVEPSIFDADDKFIGPVLPNNSKYESPTKTMTTSTSPMKYTVTSSAGNNSHVNLGSKLVKSNENGEIAPASKPLSQALKQYSNDKPSTFTSPHKMLPSMPKLTPPPPPKICNNNLNESALLSPPKTKVAIESREICKTPTTKYPSSVVIKPKSLVPYDSNDDSETDDDNQSKSSKSSTSSIKRKKIESLVKTKAGIWEVSEIPSTIVLPSVQGCTAKKAIKHKPNMVSATNKSANEINGINKTNGIHNKSKDSFDIYLDNNVGNKVSNNNDTVNQLTKLSHQGYGVPGVVSWSGDKPAIEKEISNEKREERKRYIEDERENEMDRGRVKKVKLSHDKHENRSNSNGSHNRFQEYHNGSISNTNRHKWITPNSNGSSTSSNSKFYQSKNDKYHAPSTTFQNRYRDTKHNKFKGHHKIKFNTNRSFHHHHHHKSYNNNRRND